MSTAFSSKAKRALLSSVLSLGLAIGLVGCSGGPAAEVTKAIDELSKANEATIDDMEAIEDAYAALTDEEKSKVKNYEEYLALRKDYNQYWYKTTKEQIDNAKDDLKSYFAQYFDTKNLKAALKEAEGAIKSSSEDSYETACKALSAELDSFVDFVNDQAEQSYSSQTREGKYPFAVDRKLISSDWDYKPLVKYQSEKTPEWIVSTDDYAADRNAIIPFIDGSGRPYSFKLKTVSTKKITVETAEGEYCDAYVNTEVTFKQLEREEVNRDKYRELIERPGYFLVNEDGAPMLALKSFDGKKHYVLYTFR